LGDTYEDLFLDQGCGSMKKKLLLVEDESIIALSEKISLEKFDFDVIATSDITEKVLSVKLSKENENKYKSIINISPIPMALNDNKGNITFLNLSFVSTFGYTLEDIPTLERWWTVAYPDSEYREWAKKIWNDKLENSIRTKTKFVPQEVTIKCKNGELKTIIASASTSEIIYQEHIAVLFDITDRKEAELKIESLLKEKELMMKEVHHRIKNNMTIVSSVLGLQLNSSSNPEVIFSLRDAVGRINNQSLLYYRLYRSANFSELNVKEYFSSLIQEILDSFGRKEISLELDIDSFLMSSSNIQPVGMIINELITNSMKYAFVGKKDGIISVSIKKNDKIILTVKDNGVGMPEDLTGSGFGFTLIEALVEQLMGSMEIKRNNGTQITIIIPKLEIL